MGNPLLNKLQANDKKGLFKRTQTAITYRTGYTPLDYRNGYWVEVRDMDDNVVERYPSLGIVGGSFITLVGKSGVAKTTAAVQFAANIVRPFDAGLVEHFDLEQALTYTRIRQLTSMTQQQLTDKYILKQEKCTIEDIQESIVKIATTKLENREEFSYDTGLKNEFNEPIRALVPTIIIVDSIPTLTTRDASEEMEGGTYANRVAKAIAQFYKKLTPIIKGANIIVIAINHINQKIEINAMVKTQPQLLYMKTDESMPGGNAPIYFAHNLLKFVSAGKYFNDKTNKAHVGFDGFKVRCELLKSRTNKAGQFCHLAYNQVYGFDPAYTMYEYLSDNNLVGGARNNSKYVEGFDTLRFDRHDFRNEFFNSPELRNAIFATAVPYLEAQLPKPEDITTAKQSDILLKLGVFEETE